MPQQVQEVVSRAKNAPVELVTISVPVPVPGPGEAVVKIQRAGCAIPTCTKGPPQN